MDSYEEYTDSSSSSEEEIVNSAINSPQSYDDDDDSRFDYPEIDKELGEIIITVHHVSKGIIAKVLYQKHNNFIQEYNLKGRDEAVCALKDIHLYPGNEFYPIRKLY